MRAWCGLGLAVLAWVCLPANAAVRGKEVRYVGGTIAGMAQGSEGEFDFTDPEVAVFQIKGGVSVSIPYKNITSLEYGQKAGRRVGVAIAVSPLFLFSKKRKHYLTIGFVDDQGAKQGIVLELAKGIVRSTLGRFEGRSGRKVEYESEDARKHVGD